MAVRLIKKSWWVDFTFDYKRYRKRSPENSKAGAQAYEAVLRQKLARGEEIEINSPSALSKDDSFQSFAWRWYEEYVLSNNKYLVQRNKRFILAGSLIPFFGKLPVRSITPHHIEQFKARLCKQGKSNKTINNHLGILNTCLVTAYEWMELAATPPKIKMLKCVQPRPDYLSADECQSLLSNAEGVIREMILTALRTGMRQGELKGLQWTSIEWENRNMVVRHSHCDRRKILTTPKSNRERHVPLDTEVYETLLRRKRSTGYVFLDAKGRPFAQRRMASEIDLACQRAGLRKIGWHTLRHTFATQLAMKGVPLTAVQSLLGHSTIATTMRYAHVAPSTLRSAIDLLSPRRAELTDFGQPAGNQWLALFDQEADANIRKPENR